MVKLAWPAPALSPAAHGRDSGQKMKELERLISITLARFVDLPAAEIDAEIEATMRLIVELCGFHSCCLVAVSDDKSEPRTTHSYQADVMNAPPGSCAFRTSFPWSCANLVQGNILCVSRLTELPPEAALDRQSYESMGVQSILAVPIYLQDSVEFFVTAYAVSSQGWREESILLLCQAGEVFAHALERLRNERVVESRLQFERFVSDLSMQLLNTAPERLDSGIARALQQTRVLLQFDRCALATFSPDTGEMVLTHTCGGEWGGALPGQPAIALSRWARERLAVGDLVWVSGREETSPDAGAGYPGCWIGRDVKSNVTIPIVVHGKVEFLLTAADLVAGRQRDNHLLSLLRLVGEVLAGAVVRRDLESRCSLLSGELEFLRGKHLLELQYPEVESPSCQRHEQIIGQSAPLTSTLLLAEKVAPTASTVLVTGETGTGKELIALVIHQLGPRGNKPMVKVNCASLPAALVESELFGREKGAYTGALTRQPGRFEIAELSLELQAKLLRVLQEGEFERLGSTKTIKVDVRVIAATNRNLAEEVQKGRFREDLYYRINVFQIVVPPLRDRVEDIPLLVWSFVNEFGEKMGKKINKISKQEMAALQRYAWPGNVRELRNVIERAVIVSVDDRLQVRLPEEAREQESGIVTLAECEARHIQEVLRLTNGRIKGKGGAAELLGLNPSTLYSRMQKSGIAPRIQGRDEISP